MSNIKSFIEFISENKKEKEKGVIPDPIHFKHHNKKEEKIPDVPSPIHYKHHDDNKKNLQELFGWFKKKKWIEPKLPPAHNWITKRKDVNNHLGENPDDISKGLVNQRTSKFNSKETSAILDYTDHSAYLNRHLIDGKELPKELQNTHSGIQSAIQRNPIKTPLHLYSGVSFNPIHHLNNEGKLHSPAFMSLTHYPNVAYHFAKQAEHLQDGKTKKIRHIIHLHAMPGDPIAHIADKSTWPREQESIVNAGTTLRHTGTEIHKDENSDSEVHEHHFVIHR